MVGPRWSRFWTRLSVQIAVGILAVIVITGAVALWRVDAIVGRNTEQRFNEDLQRSADQVGRELERDGRLSVIGAMLVANRPELTESIRRGDTAAAQRLVAALQSVFNSTGLTQQDGLTVYDAQGAVLFRAHAPEDRTQQGTPPLVRETVSDRGAGWAIYENPTLGLVIAAAAPIVTAEGQLVGVVEMSTQLDDSIARRLSETMGTHVAIVGSGGLTGTDTPGWDPSAALPGGDAPEGLFNVDVSGETFLSTRVPLTDADGATIANIYTGISRAAIDEDQAAARWGVLAAIAVSLAVGVLFAAGVSVLMLRPLSALVSSARRIQENDLQSAVPRTGSREFRELGGALDDMREAIREAREELIGVNVGLSRSIEASAANLSAATLELSVMHTIAARLANRGLDGMAAATEDLTRLAWVDGAFVALTDERGELAVVAAHGLPAEGAQAALETLEQPAERSELDQGVFVENIMSHPSVASLLVHGVGGLAALELETSRGMAGILVVTNTSPFALPEARRALLRSISNEMAVTVERSALAGQVEESRRLAESVLREMSDGMIVLDAMDRCRVCNPAAEQMLRVDRWEILGQPAAEWLPIPATGLETLRLRAHGDDEESYLPVNVEVAGREIAVTASRFVDSDSAHTGLILLLRDLTEGATAERMKQDFVSMVGHELRTPLTLIRASIDLLSEEGAGELTSTQTRITDVLRGNSDRLLNLINDLLDMSALDSGRLQVRPVNINLAEVIHDTIESHRREAQDHRIELRAELASPSIAVWADRGRVRQVLSNLIGNAVKYTPAGGHVLVRVTPGNPSVRVDVQDDGIGVPPAEQEQLFEKFYRTRSGQRQSGGTGLGLAIARSIVELHGGEIWCESDGKGGSTFSFTLPRRRNDDGYVAY